EGWSLVEPFDERKFYGRLGSVREEADPPSGPEWASCLRTPRSARTWDRESQSLLRSYGQAGARSKLDGKSALTL
ncbi:MAG: hypothetical protein ABGY10_10820, partial [bacterium]